MKLLFNVLRVAVFLLVIYLLLKEVTYNQVKAALSQVNWLLFALSFTLYLSRYTLQGIRWYNAAVSHDINHPLFFYIKSQIEIAFLEIVFPVPDSEDALRMLKLKSLSVDIAQSSAIILFDRIMGILLILILLPFTGWLVADIIFKDIALNYLIISIGFISLFVVAITYRKIITLVLTLAEKYLKLEHSFFPKLKENMGLEIKLRYQVTGLLASAAYCIASAACAWVLIQSLGTHLSFISLLLCIPFFFISQTFPLSYQGLGLYEATLIFVLQQLGMGTEMAMIIGTLHFLFHIIVILIGGGIFLTNPVKIRLPAINFWKKTE